jgi:hypothetical protein
VVLPKTAHAIGARDAARLTALLTPFLTATDPEASEQPAS